MNIDLIVIPVTKAEKQILNRLLEFYLYDVSHLENLDVNNNGEFVYERLDSYWTNENRYPFIAKVSDKIIGFALVNDHCYLSDCDYCMAEFFIMKKYRRQGFGRTFAFNIFDKFFGKWELRPLVDSLEADKFWTNIVAQYTSNNYELIAKGSTEWQREILKFNSSKFKPHK